MTSDDAFAYLNREWTGRYLQTTVPGVSTGVRPVSAQGMVSGGTEIVSAVSTDVRSVSAGHGKQQLSIEDRRNHDKANAAEQDVDVDDHPNKIYPHFYQLYLYQRI